MCLPAYLLTPLAFMGRSPFAIAADNVAAPGAAEALAVKAYRMVRTESISAAAALGRCLLNYQNPIATEILEAQIRLAVQEATDLSFVPKELRQQLR